MAKSGHAQKDYTGEDGSRGARKVRRHQVHNRLPSAPIPLRASANPTIAGNVRPRHPRAYPAVTPKNDISHALTLPHPVLYSQKTAGSPVGSSSSEPFSMADHASPILSSSADITELDTQPCLKKAVAGDDISEIDTVPPPDAPTVAEASIVPGAQSSTVLTEHGLVRPVEERASVLYTRPVMLQDKRSRPAFHFNPLDDLRWWLVRPGRIEFLLWLIGTLLLIVVTTFFMFLIAVNINKPGSSYFTSGRVLPTENAINTTQCADIASGENENSIECTPVIASSSNNLKIMMLDGDLIKMGSAMHLHGQGFSPLGQINFTHDAHLPCQPASVQADAHGEFFVAISLGSGLDWQPGQHQVTVDDVVSQRSIILTIMLMPEEQTATATTGASTPTPDLSPVASSPTATSGSAPASQASPPVRKKPTRVPPAAPIKPTHPPVPPPVKPTRIPTPIMPSPTPTVEVMPTPTIQDATPTPSPDTNVTPTPENSPPASQIAEPVLLAFNTMLPPDTNFTLLAGCLLWMGYCLLLLLLGLIRHLHRQRH